MIFIYPVNFYPWEDGIDCTGEVPDLPGCVSEGNDLAEAIFMIKDAATGWIIDELDSGKESPLPSGIENIKLDEEGFIDLIEFEVNH